jgi:hypothetical protein
MDRIGIARPMDEEEHDDMVTFEPEVDHVREPREQHAAEIAVDFPEQRRSSFQKGESGEIGP